MGGIDAGNAILVHPQHCADDARQHAALGAMSVQHVRPQTLDRPVAPPNRRHVREAHRTADRHARQAECQERLYFVKQRILMRSACQAVADDPDVMAGPAVLLGQIAHMPEDPANGRPEAMDNAQRLRH